MGSEGFRRQNEAMNNSAAETGRDAETAAAELSSRQWRQIGWITFAAIGVFAVLRWLPTGTNLSHMDFRVDAKNPIEFCDPLNPQFIPVVTVASPVSMQLNAPPAISGREVVATVQLHTGSGKPIGPPDLLVVHTEKLHLLIVDPTLTDYQHVHPAPTGTAGEWGFRFTPRSSGAYRIFADFTPTATNRGLYANAELNVSGESKLANDRTPGWVVERDGFRYSLTPASEPVKAAAVTDLTFVVTRSDGGAVPLQPVMGAYAHLVAFDEARSGFAHLHPAEISLTPPPDALHPTLHFKITIPRAGHYVIWAQINLGGKEAFVPFWFDVVK
jgi:hypothetical protein